MISAKHVIANVTTLTRVCVQEFKIETVDITQVMMVPLSSDKTRQDVAQDYATE
jgi:hypothetical protein